MLLSPHMFCITLHVRLLLIWLAVLLSLAFFVSFLKLTMPSLDGSDRVSL